MVGGNKFALNQIANFDCGLSNCELLDFFLPGTSCFLLWYIRTIPRDDVAKLTQLRKIGGSIRVEDFLSNSID